MQFLNKYKWNYQPYTTKDDEGHEVFCDVDPFAGQDFNINDHGFIRNDISAAMQATSQSEFDARLARLQVIPEESSGLSDEQLFDSILPRYAQSPKDVVRFTQFIASKNDKDSSELDEPSENVSKDNVNVEPKE